MKPISHLKNRPCVYGIMNHVNRKIYIGRTKCIYKRCHQYLYDFRNRSIGHLNNHLFNSMKLHGIDSFSMFPIEFCELKDDLPVRELYWMDQYDSTNRDKGYNLRRDSSTKMITHPETSEKISRNLRQQWRDGVRDNHSEKLKLSWSNDHMRREKQSELLSRIKTKYKYTVTHPSGHVETCFYKRLETLGITSAVSNFHRSKSDDVICKGFRVVRRKYES